MALPILASPAADPIAIDPGVAYPYVLPVQGATSIQAFADAGAPISVSAVTLWNSSTAIFIVKFIGTPPSTPTTYSVIVHATNASGTTIQTINFQVGGGGQITSSSTAINLIASAGNPNYVLADGSVPLKVDDAIRDNTGAIYYVVSVDPSGPSAQFSATPHGSPVTPVASFNLTDYACTATQGQNDIWVGDSSKLTPGEAIQISYSVAGLSMALPPELQGTLYVLWNPDKFHTVVSASPSGTPITPSASSYTRSAVVVTRAAGNRQIPNITTAASSSAALGGGVSVAITTDIAADSVTAYNLPAGLTLSGNTISGTPPSTNATYAIALVATKGNYTTERYWVLIVGTGGPFITGGGVPGGGGPGGTPGTLPGVPLPSGLGRVLYDGDYTQAQLASLPDYIIPFSTDPKIYIYRLSYWQFAANFTPAAFGSPGPFGGTCVGEVPGSFKDMGGGVLEFKREFAFLPNPRDEWESFNYSFQFLTGKVPCTNNSGGDTGPSNGSGCNDAQISYAIEELPETVNTRVHFDYIQTNDPTTITLQQRPHVALVDGVPIEFNGWGSIVPGTEILAEDATFKQWKGNIYERKQRYVISRSGL